MGLLFEYLWNFFCFFISSAQYGLDQSRIKDLRTGIETGNTQAVLDGDLDKFIEASLKSGL